MFFYSLLLLFAGFCFSPFLGATDSSLEKSPESQPKYFIPQSEYHQLSLHQNVITGELFVVAKLNQQPVKLLLDTGCNFTNITHQTAQKLKLNIQKSDHKIMGVGGQQQRIFAQIDCLEILPSIQFKNTTLDINKLNSPHFDGILGMDVLQNRGAIIDMNRKVIYFAKNPQKIETSNHFPKLPFAVMEIKQGLRLLNVKINDINVKMLLDTGGQQTLIDLNVAQQAKLKLMPISATMEGTGPRSAQLQYAIPKEIRLGNFLLSNLPCLCPDLAQLKNTLGASGMIAGSLLPRLGAIIYIDQNKIFFSCPDAELSDTGIIPGYFPNSINLQELFKKNPLICSAQLHGMPKMKSKSDSTSQIIFNMEYKITEIFQDQEKKFKVGDLLKFPISFYPKTKQWQPEFEIYLNHVKLPIIFLDPSQNNGEKIYQADTILLPGSPARNDQLRKKVQ